VATGTSASNQNQGFLPSFGASELLTADHVLTLWFTPVPHLILPHLLSSCLLLVIFGCAKFHGASDTEYQIFHGLLDKVWSTALWVYGSILDVIPRLASLSIVLLVSLLGTVFGHRSQSKLDLSQT
jgi:hypothetical protein